MTDQSCHPGLGPGAADQMGVLQTPFPRGAEGVGRHRAPRSVHASKQDYPGARITITIGMHGTAERSPRGTQRLSRAGNGRGSTLPAGAD